MRFWSIGRRVSWGADGLRALINRVGATLAASGSLLVLNPARI